jgi:predicted house-cleaning noncanonical NTP pyrophosphatase (MazG superfamily)
MLFNKYIERSTRRPVMRIKFPVYISNGGEITLYHEIDEEELELIKEAVDEGEVEFEDVEELADLYQVLVDEAYDEMANGMLDNPDFINMYIGDDYDFEKVRDFIVNNFDITIDYPDVD